MIAIKLKSRALVFLIYVLVFENVVLSEYRTLNGTNNDKDGLGVVNMPFVRQQVPVPNFLDNAATMVSTPGNYSTLSTGVSCATSLPAGNLPLPRCVSDVLHSYQLKPSDSFNLTHLQQFKSKRSISHVLTYWGLFIKMDPYLAFNRSQGPGNVGINSGTPFLDASHIYGVTDDRASLLRDTGNRGKMRLIISSQSEDGKLGYPPKDSNGEYIFGFLLDKGRNVFTDDVMSCMRFMATLGLMKLIIKKQEDGLLHSYKR
ncbi:hypothetical protein C2G38_144235 [Gigaspora rosea]|uniref:Uncharacterized protein n=1 Tax=Gigaspora rosea TaxID=44941 RepID=A0A397W3M2_9GLOM|nr:hypothetical protein C2G38_144235 [Gigaspora rosea]